MKTQSQVPHEKSSAPAVSVPREPETLFHMKTQSQVPSQVQSQVSVESRRHFFT